MLQTRTFLILDDVDVNRTILRCMLSTIYKNCIIVEASSGTECIQLYDELLSSFYIIDCIFLDHMLPDMEGTDVIKKIRKLGYEGPSIMISASSDDMIKQLNSSNLFCKVIQKPLSSVKMKEIINTLLDCHKKNKNNCPKDDKK